MKLKSTLLILIGAFAFQGFAQSESDCRSSFVKDSVFLTGVTASVAGIYGGITGGGLGVADFGFQTAVSGAELTGGAIDALVAGGMTGAFGGAVGASVGGFVGTGIQKTFEKGGSTAGAIVGAAVGLTGAFFAGVEVLEWFDVSATSDIGTFASGIGGAWGVVAGGLVGGWIGKDGAKNARNYSEMRKAERNYSEMRRAEKEAQTLNATKDTTKNEEALEIAEGTAER